MTMPEDHVLTSKQELMDKICMLLGGRIAEEIVFGEITTGAQNDLQRSTELARKIVMDFGMTERFGPITFGRAGENVFLGRDFGSERDYSDNLAGEIDDEVRKVIMESYQRAKDLLIKNKRKLIVISNVLIEKETLDSDEIEGFIKQEEPKEDIEKLLLDFFSKKSKPSIDLDKKEEVIN